MQTGYMKLCTAEYLGTLKVRYKYHKSDQDPTIYSIDIINRKTFTKKLSDDLRRSFENYFKGKSRTIDVKVAQSKTCTPFQKTVWDAITKIPYGETVTYGELAKSIGKPKAYRAVANACGQNPLTIIVPCHRVVSSTGLGGYSCGVDIKEYLLQLEREHK